MKIVCIIKTSGVVELTSRLLGAGEGTARDAGDDELFDDVIDEA